MATAKKPAAKKTAAKKPATKKVVSKKSTTVAPKVVAKKVVAPVSTKTEKPAVISPSALLAELLGTFLLVSAFFAFGGDKISILFAVIAIFVVFFAVSGAHINPAITIATAINKKIAPAKAGAYIIAQVLGAALAFFVGQAIVNETNATYSDDGTRTVATLESKLLEQGVTQEAINQAGGLDAFLANYGGKTAVAKQLGISSQYSLAPVASHKEAFTLSLEVLGSIILGLGAGFVYGRKNDKCHTIKSAFVIAGALFIGLAVAGTTGALNPALAGALGAFNDLQNYWSYAIYILGSIIGVTLGYTLYKVILKDFNEDIVLTKNNNEEL